MADAYDDQAIKPKADYFVAPVASDASTRTRDLLGMGAVDSPAGFGSPAPPVAGSPAGLPAKHLDFGAPRSAPPTPVTPVPFKGPSSSDPVVDYNQFVLDTLLWKNKVRSAFYFAVGLLQAWIFYRFIFTANTPVISGVCFVLLLNLALNFARSLMTSRTAPGTQWSSSSLTRGLIYLFTEGVTVTAAVLDKHLSAVDPGWTLQVAGGLWILSLLARSVSAFNLLVGLHVAAFTVPLGYNLFKPQFDKILHGLWATITSHYSQLDRKLKVAIVGGPILLLAFVLSRVDLAISILIFCIFVRSLLQPSEVAAISRNVAPYTATASKLTSRVLNTAGDAAARFDLTPTPAKKTI